MTGNRDAHLRRKALFTIAQVQRLLQPDEIGDDGRPLGTDAGVSISSQLSEESPRSATMPTTTSESLPNPQ